jgi:hypothetical protein
MHSSGRARIIGIALMLLLAFVTPSRGADPLLEVMYHSSLYIWLPEGSVSYKQLNSTREKAGMLEGSISSNYNYTQFDIWTLRNFTVHDSASGRVSVDLYSLKTGGIKPNIDVYGKANDGRVSAEGSILYAFQLDKKVLGALDVNITVNINVDGMLHAEAGGEARDRTFVTYTLRYKGPADLYWITLYIAIAISDGDEGKNDLDFKKTYVMHVVPGKQYQVWMLVQGYAYGVIGSQTETYGNGEYGGIVDPVIEIDPNQMIEYNGNLVPATSLYSLSFIPGLVPDTDPGQGVLSVTPADGFHSEALVGQPFVPPSKTYTLQNTGLDPIDWTATPTSADNPFLVSKTAGTLLPGQEDTVTVTVNDSFLFMLGVNQSQTIHFNNVTNRQGNTTRLVDAIVGDPSQGSLSLTPADGFHSEALVGKPFVPAEKTYTLKNTGAGSIEWLVNPGSNDNAFLLSNRTGALLPGQEDTVTVTVNDSYSFTPGVRQSRTIRFINLTNPQGNTTRKVDAIVVDRRGDVNGDYTVNLSDAISVLGFMAGVQPSGNLYTEADANGDDKIGVEEVLYILQKLAGLR